MATIELSFDFDATEFVDGLKELSAFAEQFEAVREIFDRFLDIPDSVGKLYRIKPDIGTAEARKGLICLQPSDFLSDLLAALRAGDFDLSVFNFICNKHGISPLISDVKPRSTAPAA